MTKMYFSYRICLLPLFLAHSFPNPWNFLSSVSNGNIFGHNVWSPILSSGKYFRVIKVHQSIVIHDKPLPNTTRFLLIRQLGNLVRNGSVAGGTNPVIKVWE